MDKNTFNFNKYSIEDKTKEYILDREKILFTNFKSYSKRLFNICKAVSEIQFILKTNYGPTGDITFVEWYKFRGFNKDKISELTKRYELYVLAPDKTEYISSLSIPAVKLLTKKKIDVEVREKIILLEPKTTKEIIELLKNENMDQQNKTHELVNPQIKKTYNFFKNKLKKVNNNRELMETKKELQQMKKIISELEKDVLDKEKEYENQNNMKLAII